MHEKIQGPFFSPNTKLTVDILTREMLGAPHEVGGKEVGTKMKGI